MNGGISLKYMECGIGNRWLLRTETEWPDGTETEQKGLAGPVKYHSCYIRVWMGRRVWILDSKEGCKRQRKQRKAFKIIVGIASYL